MPLPDVPDAIALVTAVRGSHADLDSSEQAVHVVAALTDGLDEHQQLALVLALARVTAAVFDELQRLTGHDALPRVAAAFAVDPAGG